MDLVSLHFAPINDLPVPCQTDSGLCSYDLVCQTRTLQSFRSSSDGAGTDTWMSDEELAHVVPMTPPNLFGMWQRLTWQRPKVKMYKRQLEVQFVCMR